MKKLAPALAIVAFAALVTRQPEKVPHITLGTHAPVSATKVWRVAMKSGGSASAVPVALKPGTTDTMIFLTAKHVGAHLGDGAVVESMDRLRKLPIVFHSEHATEDIGVLHVKLTAADSKPIPLVLLGLDVELEPGLSVFSCGYPGPITNWFVARGYLGADRYVSAPVFSGMSGGSLLLTDGRLVGILEGFMFETDNKLTMVWDRHPKADGAKTVGAFFARRDRNEQGAYTSLAKVRPWLINQHVVTR